MIQYTVHCSLTLKRGTLLEVFKLKPPSSDSELGEDFSSVPMSLVRAKVPFHVGMATAPF